MNNNFNSNAFREKAAYTFRRIKQYKSSYAFIAPFLLIFTTFTVLPVIIAMFFSFTEFDILNSAKFVGIENYKNLFIKDPLFLTSVKNTLIFSGITGPISYLMCLLLAWFVNDLGPKVRSLLTLLFYAPTLTNIFYVWQIIFSGDANGFFNSYLIKLGLIQEPVQWLTDEKYLVCILIFVLLWASLGTSFLALIAGFQNVDTTLYEAGAVDGIKNRWQELWYITLPYMKPQLLFSAVISITNSFGIGSTIDVLCGNPSTGYKAWTMMNHLTDFGNVRFEMGYACAIATILFIVMLASNTIIQKLIAKVGD